MFNNHRLEFCTLLVIAFFVVSFGTVSQASPGVSAEDAKGIMPVSQLKRGMKGYGLTVFHGTKIEKFDVEILGVLKKMNTGKDLILVRVAGGPITSRDTGIIAGMSGSPCYINGKLVGAVAYGSGYAKEPIGMLTPIEDMLEAWDDNLPKHASGFSSTQSLPEPMNVGGESVSRIKIDRPGDRTIGVEDGTLHMQPLMTPLMVSGLSPRGIGRLAEILEPFHIRPIAGPGGAPKNAGLPELSPGAAVGMSLATGDIDLTAIGTLTYRRGDRVLAFGHPMLGIGAVDAPMTTAYVDDVISSYRQSTKMASPIRVVGRVFQDRPWSIAGVMGKQAKTIPATIQVDDRMFGRSRTYRVGVLNHPLLASRIVTMIVGEAIYDTHPAPGDATAEVTYEVTADQIGKVTRTNVFFDPVAIDAAAISDIGSLLNLLSSNRFHPLDIQSVDVKVRILDRRNTASIDRIFVKESEYEPGETVDVGVVLRPYMQERVTKTFSIKIPATATDGKITLIVRGGGTPAATPMITGSAPGDEGGDGSPPGASAPIVTGSDMATADNVRQLVQKYLEREKNNDIVLQLAMRGTTISVAGEKLTGLPSAIADVMKSSRSSGLNMQRDEVKVAFPQDTIVHGSATLSLNVKRKEWRETKPTNRVQPSSSEDSAETDTGSTSIAMGTETYDYERIPGGLTAMAEPSVTVTEEPALDETTEKSTEEAPSETPSGTPTGATGTSAASKTEAKNVVRQPKTWSQRTQTDFAKGTYHGVSPSSKNQLQLAPALTKLLDTSEQFVWCVVPADGGVYAGTGDAGRVYRITDKGESSVFFETNELEVHALARDPQGNVYAATSPNGKVFKISPDGKGSLLFDAPEKFILALALDQNGNLYAGTGDAGRVYRIGADGSSVVFADLGEQQVLSLCWDGQDSLLVGTGINGVVYRVDSHGWAEPIFGAEESSVTAVLATADGNVYAGTSPKGIIYRISPDGRSKTLFSRATRVLSMICDSRNNVYAVSDGTVVRLCPDETLVQMDPSHDKVQFLSMTYDEKTDNLYAGTGSIGSIYTGKCGNTVGQYESPVHDARMISRWGRIRWTAVVPQGAAIELQTRTGNVATPDQTWSDWSPPYSQSAGDQILSKDGRYIQYRVTLKAGNDGASPKVSAVTISYLTPNQAPVVKLTAPAGGDVWSGKETIRWSGSDPDKDTLTYDVYYSSDNGKEWKPLVGGIAGGSNGLAEPDKRSTESEVIDKVRSELEKSPDVPEEMKKQVLKDQPGAAAATAPAPASGVSADSSSKTSHTWDTSKAADGEYLIKVVASDKTSNASGSQTGEVISEPFVICNTPPKLTVYKRSVELNGAGPATITGTASSQLVDVTGVQYRIDGGAYTAAECRDGVFDSAYEAFTVTTGNLTRGKHKVEVQAIDRAGNSASATVEVTVT